MTEILIFYRPTPLQVKAKAFTVQAMKAYRAPRGIAPLILNLGTRWRRLSTKRPWRAGYHFAGFLYIFQRAFSSEF